tara:strand:- start:3146 stop:3874 length:729 start_codon:yes stop_codon:yes gene_type:complete
MPFDYTYTATTGNVKVQNVVFGFDKRNGKVTAEFDLRAVEVTPSSNEVTAKLEYSSAVKTEEGIDSPQDRFARHTISWTPSDELNLSDYGSQTITLKVYDEDDVLCHTSTGSIDLDLDPIEFECTITSNSLGSDSTPDITFKLEDLLSEQTIVPIITVSGSNSSGCKIYLDDGDGTTTEVNQSTNRFGCLNGVKFSESSMSFSNTSPQNATYFKRIDSYKITAPTMASGFNSYTINLQANAV